jgi:phosphoribosylformylglycinamidine synthase PurS subunit
MKFRAEISVMPQEALLDPQGKAVHQSMATLGLVEVTNVRIGKRIAVELSATNETEATAMVERACKELLVNQVMEVYEYSLKPEFD